MRLQDDLTFTLEEQTCGSNNKEDDSKIVPENSRFSLRFCNYPGCTAIYRASLSGPLAEFCPRHRKEKEAKRKYKVKSRSTETDAFLSAARWEVVNEDC